MKIVNDFTGRHAPFHVDKWFFQHVHCTSFKIYSVLGDIHIVYTQILERVWEELLTTMVPQCEEEKVLNKGIFV